jgi:hypothetical protein
VQKCCIFQTYISSDDFTGVLKSVVKFLGRAMETMNGTLKAGSYGKIINEIEVIKSQKVFLHRSMEKVFLRYSVACELPSKF